MKTLALASYLTVWKLTVFPIRSETWQACPSHLSVQHLVQSPASAVRREKDVAGVWIGEEKAKLSLFAGNTIVYIENSTKST